MRSPTATCRWCSARSRRCRCSRWSRTSIRPGPRRRRATWASPAGARTGARWSRDPRVDVVDITAPNDVHREIALAALAAGKPVYCEKPLANSAAETREMAEAAAAAGRADAGRLQLPEEPGASLCARADPRGRARRDHAVPRHLRSGPAERSRLPVHLAPRARGRGLRRARRHGLAHARLRPVPGRRHRRGVRHVRDLHPRAAARGERHRPERARRAGRGPARRSRTTTSPSSCCALRTARSARSARAASAPGARWA